MFAQLIEAAGVWFLVAAAAELVAVLVEQAAAARSPEEEAPRRGGPSAALLAVSALLAPGLLLAHGFLATHGGDTMLRAVAVGTPIAAMIVGALLGGILGAVAKGAAPLMRRLALPLGLIALAVTIFATWPSIQTLITAAQNGGVIYVE
ncbi:MAG: hypothetical protein AB7O98_12835 [Hyphomonadaceae bacterium]